MNCTSPRIRVLQLFLFYFLSFTLFGNTADKSYRMNVHGVYQNRFPEYTAVCSIVDKEEDIFVAGSKHTDISLIKVPTRYTFLVDCGHSFLIPPFGMDKKYRAVLSAYLKMLKKDDLFGVYSCTLDSDREKKRAVKTYVDPKLKFTNETLPEFELFRGEWQIGKSIESVSGVFEKPKHNIKYRDIVVILTYRPPVEFAAGAAKNTVLAGSFKDLKAPVFLVNCSDDKYFSSVDKNLKHLIRLSGGKVLSLVAEQQNTDGELAKVVFKEANSKRFFLYPFRLSSATPRSGNYSLKTEAKYAKGGVFTVSSTTYINVVANELEDFSLDSLKKFVSQKEIEFNKLKSACTAVLKELKALVESEKHQLFSEKVKLFHSYEASGAKLLKEIALFKESRKLADQADRLTPVVEEFLMENRNLFDEYTSLHKKYLKQRGDVQESMAKVTQMKKLATEFEFGDETEALLRGVLESDSTDFDKAFAYLFLGELLDRKKPGDGAQHRENGLVVLAKVKTELEPVIRVLQVKALRQMKRSNDIIVKKCLETLKQKSLNVKQKAVVTDILGLSYYDLGYWNKGILLIEKALKEYPELKVNHPLLKGY